MKNSGPLRRNTPLPGGKPLAAGAPLRTSKPLDRTRPMGRSESATSPTKPRAASPSKLRRATGPTAATLALVDRRDRHLCVKCGGPASDHDHRRGRGMGGTKGAKSDQINGPAWLLTLCGMGNTSGCHGWKESNRDQARALGYRIDRNGPEVDAAAVPVLTHTGWALFLNDGTRVPYNPLETQ